MENQFRMSKRTFIKSAATLGVAGALAGPSAPFESAAIAQESGAGYMIVPGSAPHNCGGRCVIRAYVQNGVIKKFITDELPDDMASDNPQKRACVRCRSRADQYYRHDRLIYPMKQTKERGDVNGFVKISWSDAYKDIGSKLKQIASDSSKGPQTIFNLSSSGGGATPGTLDMPERMLNLLGGSNSPHPGYGYSYPALEYMSLFFFGGNYLTPPGNSRQDFVNAQQIVLWSYNSAETVMGTNTTYYLTLAKEKGVKIVVVDPRISKTVSTLADVAINPIPGTDAAVLLAMMYHLLKNKLDVPGGISSDFIKKYVHGFFDDPAPKHYHKNAPVTDDLDKYVVPAGASLSAYIMGMDDTLVKRGLNQALSIYPQTIGYNFNKTDALSSKRAPIYGQTAKTPAWAEKISGVPADDIIKLAESIASQKNIITLHGGFQRNTESEQAPWLLYTLGAITGNFGESGRSIGFHNDKAPIGSVGMPTGDNNVIKNNKLYDMTQLTSKTWTPAFARNTFPNFMVADVIKNGGTGKSDWNCGQVKKMPAVKAIVFFGWNGLVNQDADPASKAAILKNKKKVELIVGVDQFMTSSMRYADYILPTAMPFEKNQVSQPWHGFGETMIYMNKAVEPVGEAKEDYEICAGIAGGFGKETEFRGAKGKRIEQWIEENYRALNKKLPYERWKNGEPAVLDPSVPAFIAHANFRKDPAASPLNTPSGKMEAYSQALMEDYCARFNDNIDANGKVSLKMPLHDGKTDARFVYPIPMYIPTVNGMHADGSHPDLLKQDEKYPFMVNVYHSHYRSHSVYNNNRYLNAIYKRDSEGMPAFLPADRISMQTWDDGVYEPVYINPSDALKLDIFTGSKIILRNEQGALYATAVLSEQTRQGVVVMAEGSWFQQDASGIDIGGCMNTLGSLRPSRIIQGCTVGSDHRVQIVKA